MDPEIKILPPKKLIGMSIDTSLTEYGAPGLWQRFMPRVKSIENKVGSEKYSIQIYDNLFSYSDFHPKLIFKYWAATEVQSFESVPKEMEALELPGGKYAVFTHKGTMAGFQKTLNFIHLKWLPDSEFELDHRPHFEVLDDRYLGPNNPESIEEVWIPIK
ncbi:MAG TPA: GyrI-like domain-containing protein [Balneola sp.]|nr:GyrI-like domain-containing protein [Balneola sp.]MAO78679.1 GyrI-like domain-containing protein [Balneola sp.]MBF63092.1 GyrI-like domain-containing protein [Balneola sp.]HAH49885.1 GyrI-like domain-containing protein [Balneola sp.]HAW81795.1 GyrI-like domain-containing protein [Balneola sp.]|tara:strand:+ start:5442 stop:5921 length:480 start_codon:yes stop_codon:yes gene_type:complete